MAPLDSVAALRERPFRLQFLADAASVFGDQVAPLALAFAVLDVTGSASILGIVMAARTVAVVTFLLAGGVWADRISRQRLMVTCDLVRFATQALFAALLIAGHPEMWQMIVLQVVNGAATGFFQPATTGLTPQTVSPERLQQANALLSMTRSVAAIAGPAAAGILAATVGSGWALALDAATFATSALLLSRLSLPPSKKAEAQNFVAELKDGWMEVSSRTWIWVTIVGFMVFHVFVLAPFFVLGPLIAKQSLQGAASWAGIVSALGVGSLLGDLVTLRWEPRRPLVAAKLMTLLIVPMMTLLAVAAPTPLIAAAAVIAGISFSVPDTLWYTALQDNVPDRLLSRVSSYDWMGSMVLRPAGFALAGPAAAAMGAQATLIVGGLVAALVDLSALAVPSVRELRRRSRVPEEQPTAS